MLSTNNAVASARFCRIALSIFADTQKPIIAMPARSTGTQAKANCHACVSLIRRPSPGIRPFIDPLGSDSVGDGIIVLPNESYSSTSKLFDGDSGSGLLIDRARAPTPSYRSAWQIAGALCRWPFFSLTCALGRYVVASSRAIAMKCSACKKHESDGRRQRDEDADQDFVDDEPR